MLCEIKLLNIESKESIYGGYHSIYSEFYVDPIDNIVKNKYLISFPECNGQRDTITGCVIVDMYGGSYILTFTHPLEIQNKITPTMPSQALSLYVDEKNIDNFRETETPKLQIAELDIINLIE